MNKSLIQTDANTYEVVNLFSSPTIESMEYKSNGKVIIKNTKHKINTLLPKRIAFKVIEAERVLSVKSLIEFTCDVI